MKVGIKFINPYVTIMYRNDELSLLFTKYSELFILFAENYQILLKISVIPILLTSIYLVALNLLVNNQLNSSLRHIIVTLKHFGEVKRPYDSFGKQPTQLIITAHNCHKAPHYHN